MCNPNVDVTCVFPIIPTHCNMYEGVCEHLTITCHGTSKYYKLVFSYIKSLWHSAVFINSYTLVPPIQTSNLQNTYYS